MLKHVLITVCVIILGLSTTSLFAKDRRDSNKKDRTEKIFKAIDANKDGSVTLKEFKSFHKKHMKAKNKKMAQKKHSNKGKSNRK